MNEWTLDQLMHCVHLSRKLLIFMSYAYRIIIMIESFNLRHVIVCISVWHTLKSSDYRLAVYSLQHVLCLTLISTYWSSYADESLINTVVHMPLISWIRYRFDCLISIYSGLTHIACSIQDTLLNFTPLDSYESDVRL